MQVAALSAAAVAVGAAVLVVAFVRRMAFAEGSSDVPDEAPRMAPELRIRTASEASLVAFGAVPTDSSSSTTTATYVRSQPAASGRVHGHGQPL